MKENSISSKNYSAMLLAEEIGKELVPYKDEILKLLGNEFHSYEEVVRKLSQHNRVNTIKAATCRNALLQTFTIWKENQSISEEEYNEIIKRQKSQGGKEGVKKAHEKRGNILFNSVEEELIIQLQGQKELFSRGSTWDLKKVQDYWLLQTGIKRSKDVLYNKLSKDNKQRKIKPYSEEEKKDIIGLYTELIQTEKGKLPAGSRTKIAEHINTIYNNERTIYSIETLIHQWRSNNGEKKKAILKRSIEEDNYLQDILKRADIIWTSGIYQGKTNWEKVTKLHQARYPERNKKALIHREKLLRN